MKFFSLMNPYAWPHMDEPAKLAARDTDRYQGLVDGVYKVGQMLDRHGFEGVFFSEQHGNVEGVPEVTNNPILLALAVGLQTENLKVGSLGRVITVNNPLLVAEELAQLDQMTKGRALAGFSRGNTMRWADQYGQHLDMRFAPSDKSEQDLRNRRAYQEALEIIKLAWSQDTFSFDGEFWKYPAHQDDWPYPATVKWGSGREVDENGKLQEIGVAPRPYQDPHPRLFCPLTRRTATVRWWAKNYGTIVTLAGNDDFNEGMFQIYAEEAAKEDIDVAPGTGILPGGTISIAESEADAKRYADMFTAFYGENYNCPPYDLPEPRRLVGTPEMIVDQLGAVQDRLQNKEFMVWVNGGAPYGIDVQLEMLDMFGREVMPHFAD